MYRLICGLLSVVLVGIPASGQTDTQPPQLAGISIAPTNVDVTRGPQNVNVSLALTDNLSGVNVEAVFVALRSPSGTQSTGRFAEPQPGVVLSTRAVAAIPIPRFAEPGTWRIDFVRVSDNAGNSQSINNDAMVAAGFPTTVNVIDTTPDLQAPTLVSVAMSPNKLDASGGDVTVTVNLTLHDDVAGVEASVVSLSDFELRSPSGGQSRIASFPSFTRISGTATDGVWRSTFLMPRYSESGTWKIASLRLEDAARNVRYYMPDELSDYGSSIEVNVASTPVDSTPPRISGITVTPNFLNTSVGPQTVFVEMAMTDDLSGVAFQWDTPQISLYWGPAFGSPSGAQIAYINWFDYPAPISGTPLNGVWRFPATFAQYSEEGTWKIFAVQLADSTRNILRAFSPQAVADLGISADITIIKPSLTTDGTVFDPLIGGTVEDSAYGARAELIIPARVLDEPTEIAIDVLASPLGTPLPTGFSSAETYFVNVQLTPTPNYPLRAPGITLVIPLRGYVIPGTRIDLLRVDPSTGSLVRAIDVSGNPSVGRVDVGGLTATFAGIASFSTLVGALPTSIPVTIDVKPGESPNLLNTRSKGSFKVSVLSTPTLDVSKVDPATIRLSGASVSRNKQGRYQVLISDLDRDGRDDIILRFDTEGLLLTSSDTKAVLEGLTRDGRTFRGVDAVRVLK